MRKSILVAMLVVIAILASSSPASAGEVTYWPREGDGCGPPSQDGFRWANFVVLNDRICGSYPWDPQRMGAGGYLYLRARVANAHHLVSWKSDNSQNWGLDVWISGGELIQRRMNDPGLYLFRDPAHSKLVSYQRANGTWDQKCKGACGYLRVTW